MAAVAPIRLADYTPWPFALKEIELDVDLRSDHALVTNTMRLEPLAVSYTHLTLPTKRIV